MDRIYNSYFFNDFYEEQGGGNYMKSVDFQNFFENIAEHIVNEFKPKTVLDAGCAAGYLVSALRKRGVEAYGIDISEYAIEQVDSQNKKFCVVHNITEPLPAEFPQRYDLVVTIEVLEHLYEEQGKKAIANLCSYTDRIIFTSTPDDIQDQTHVNVQRAEYWSRIFAENSFYRNLFQPVHWICPWALLFEKRTEIPNIVNEYEIKLRLDSENNKKNINEIQKKIEDKNTSIEELKSELNEKDKHYNELKLENSGKEEELFQANKKLKEGEDELKIAEYNLKNKEEAISYLRKLINHYEELRNSDIDKITSLTLNLERIRQEYATLEGNFQWERSQAQRYKILFDGISEANAWKMTRPIRALADRVKKITQKEKENTAEINNNQNEIISQAQMPFSDEEDKETDYEKLFTGHRIDPIKTIIVNAPIRRLNLVTDTIEESSLLGGVATALIVATKFAVRYNYELRIITRTASINPLNYVNIIKMNQLEMPQKVSYYSDLENSDFKLELSPNDIFFATSWWSAEAIRKTSLKKRFFYIVQEVETFFYPHGVEHYLCSRIMKNKDIDFIVNSHYLYDYFSINEPNIKNNGICFEPAFSKNLYRPGIFEPKEKYKLFFYARPNNPRNLYAYGVYLLDLAFKSGIIDSEKWEVYFAGQKTESVLLASKVKVHCLGQLSWKEYTNFLREVDLTVSLMYTPHPSYPPYDAACSGSVVVTNKCYNKVSMPECKNIIVSDLMEKEFLQAIEDGVHLAQDMSRRKENYECSTIYRDWNETLNSVLEFMGDKINDV